MLNFHLVSIFPEFFDSPLQTSLLGKAAARRLISFDFHNPRDYSKNKHKHIDDAPFGGGPGMIMQAPPVYDAVKQIAQPGRILVLTPQGKQLDAQISAELAQEENITLICGRYEGIDARLCEKLPVEEIAVGNAVLNGGETAALAVIESVSRYLPGFMHASESLAEESLTGGLLEYPQFTRPVEWQDKHVPEILLSGHHAEIAKWRRKMSLHKTLTCRPKLLNNARLSSNDAEILKDFPRLRAGRNLSFCLVHHPVRLKDGSAGASSLTNLDVHDISRISHTYGMGPFYILTPLKEQLELAQTLIWHWTKGPGSKTNPDRAKALSLARLVENFESLIAEARSWHGIEPIFIAASAAWPKNSAPLSCSEILKICQRRPVIILLGTAGGLALKFLPVACEHVRPVRFLDINHLSVRSAAAILADRILGDYN